MFLLLLIATGDYQLRAERRHPQGQRVIPVAVVQFDAVPEAVGTNLGKMEHLARQAAKQGARWVMFHEGAVCDYTDKLDQLAEPVPGGPSTRRMERLARELGCYVSFGLSEKDGERVHISQVFVGPEGFVYRYRKTWLHRDPADRGFRNEYARYDPGTGPELFTLDGVRATCFICADCTSPRCIKRAGALRPQVAFHPVNVVTRDAGQLRQAEAAIARAVGAPLIVANRVGDSWMHKAGLGGAAVFDATGQLLAGAHGDGREEVIVYRLAIPDR
jgi:N-carbamoylputrescine amidase